MFIVPLDAPEQVKQVVPQVLVTLQQPAGMPEWAKIVISASVGAVFGVGGNIAMELLKPKITKGSSRKEVLAQLVIEIKRNLQQLEKVDTIIEEVKSGKRKSLEPALHFLHHIWDDSYVHYLENQPILVYELDRHKSLKDFYHTCKVDLPQAIRGGGEVDSELSGPSTAPELAAYATHMGSSFITFATRSMWDRLNDWLDDVWYLFKRKRK